MKLTPEIERAITQQLRELDEVKAKYRIASDDIALTTCSEDSAKEELLRAIKILRAINGENCG